MSKKSFICLVALLQPQDALAGMPSPLPTNFQAVPALSGSATERLQAISFFLVVFLASAGLVQLLWNFVRSDFPMLPRLSYGKALAWTFLWGLLFTIVLSMISGARELMTPGAWSKQGFTYRLVGPSATALAPDPEADRRRRFERLRTALWHFAATHQGKFPSADQISSISSDLWTGPEWGGMQVHYVAGKSAGFAPEILAYEPEVDADRRLVLQTNGDIVSRTSADLRAALASKEDRP